MNTVTLTESESLAYGDLKLVIAEGRDTFIRVGAALAQVRDKNLYREEYSTFEAFCEAEYGWKRAHAYRLMEASAVVESLSPIGDTPPPTNEAQARELAKVPKEDRAKVWDEAVKTAPVKNGKPAVTAKRIEAVATESGNREKLKLMPNSGTGLAEKAQKERLRMMSNIGGYYYDLPMDFSVMTDDERSAWAKELRAYARQFNALARKIREDGA